MIMIWLLAEKTRSQRVKTTRRGGPGDVHEGATCRSIGWRRQGGRGPPPTGGHRKTEAGGVSDGPMARGSRLRGGLPVHHVGVPLIRGVDHGPEEVHMLRGAGHVADHVGHVLGGEGGESLVDPGGPARRRRGSAPGRTPSPPSPGPPTRCAPGFPPRPGSSPGSGPSPRTSWRCRRSPRVDDVPCRASQVDHVTGVPLHHEGEDGPAHVEESLHVRVDHLLPVLHHGPGGRAPGPGRARRCSPGCRAPGPPPRGGRRSAPPRPGPGRPAPPHPHGGRGPPAAHPGGPRAWNCGGRTGGDGPPAGRRPGHRRLRFQPRLP
jgi:hypothetical protein